MSRLAHATFAASGLEAERKNLDATVRHEAKQRALQQQQDAARWRKLCELVDSTNVEVTFFDRLDTINTGLVVTNCGDLVDEIDQAPQP